MNDMNQMSVHRCGGWLLAVLLLATTAGCNEMVVNYYRETGPSVNAEWDSPTARDIKANCDSAPLRSRGWETRTVACKDGSVLHWPLYFEDPFVDKGAGRTDATDPHNVYRLGWEDWVAFPYGFSRFTLNWLLFPASVIVTPPWIVQESDGEISQQLVWRDHDARRVSSEELRQRWGLSEPAPAEVPPAEATPAPEAEAQPPETAKIDA
jgi:hypothetical protein